MAPLADAMTARGSDVPAEVVPGFALLFAASVGHPLRRERLDRPAAVIGGTALSAIQLEDYRRQRDETEVHVLGREFIAAGRLAHHAIGRLHLPVADGDARAPAAADVHLFTHVAGVALWEVWVPLPAQPLDTRRWIAALDDQAADSLPARVWKALQPLNLALGGTDTYRQYLPCIVLRLPRYTLDAVLAEHAAELVGLLWRDRSLRALKPEVVATELERDYCARQGGITMLGRRAGLDVHDGNDGNDEGAAHAAGAGLPPRSALPFLVTIELLLIERAVLLQLYERLSQRTPSSIDALLELKQEVTESLEEYYGATMAATRFGDEVAADGERLLGIVDLYDALMDRLETVSFALTTRYQRRMTQMQFWLTVVFGATEIGFIAASIATWHYRVELGAVLAWTVGAALASAGVLVALLRRYMDRP
jgi:hypothetical protein